MIQRIIRLYKKYTMSDNEYAQHLGVTVGKNCRILTDKFGSEPWLISIGDNTTITAGVFFLTHDGSTWLMNDEKGRRFLYRKVEVGSNVFIGVNSIILPGVKIEDNVIVAAGSVITKSIPSGVIVGGNPAKIIGDYDSYIENGLKKYVSKSEVDFNVDYKNRIQKVLDPSFKDFLKLK